MNPEERKLLQNTFNLAEENNKMLHKVRGVQKRQVLFSVLKWIIIIGITVGAFYFLEPYVQQLQSLIEKTGVNIDQLKNLSNTLR